MEIPIAPIIPNEILTEMLSYLGKKDLLKCRLVNQSWNEMSLKILRNAKHGHEHVLTQNTIHKFIEFSKERQEEWILPFHLNFRRGGDENSMEYHQFPNYIQQLQTVFGKTCVSGLTFGSQYPRRSSVESAEVLMSILTLLAPSLTQLDLSQFKLSYHEEGVGQVGVKVKEMLENNTDLSFPNLSKLASCPASTPAICLNGNHIHSFLIERSLNLKELEVNSSSDLLLVDCRIGTLRKLKIVEVFEQDNLSSENTSTFLEQIRIGPTPPVLKEISLIYCSAFLDYQILIEFLSLFSTTLERLSIEFAECIPDSPFPRLPHLKYLQIDASSPFETGIWMYTRNLMLNSESFPVLESIHIFTNVYFQSPVGRSMGDDWILGTVKSLTIGVTDFSFNGALDEDEINNQDDEYDYVQRIWAEEYVALLQRLLPNVTSLTLVNHTDGHEEYLCQLLVAFIQSVGAPRVQELEIQDCGQNHLGHIFNALDSDQEPRVVIEDMTSDEEFSDGSQLSDDEEMEEEDEDGVESGVLTCKAPTDPIDNKMTGLEKFRLSCPNQINGSDSGQSGIQHKSNRVCSNYDLTSEAEYYLKDLFIMNLSKNFPLLRRIDISQRMFGDDQDSCKEQINNVQEKFPDLIINTTR